MLISNCERLLNVQVLEGFDSRYEECDGIHNWQLTRKWDDESSNMHICQNLRPVISDT